MVVSALKNTGTGLDMGDKNTQQLGRHSNREGLAGLVREETEEHPWGPYESASRLG